MCGPHLELLGSHTQYACGGKGHHMAPLFVTQASDAGEPRSWCAPVHIVPLQNGSMPPCCTCHRTDALLDVAGVLFREKTREGKRRRTEKKKMKEKASGRRTSERKVRCYEAFLPLEPATLTDADLA